MITPKDPGSMSRVEDSSLSLAAKKRTRRTHPKVRTGCVTCKIRRKKCDETKPCCQRCTSTGRKCDGYLNANADDVVGTDTFDDQISERSLSQQIPHDSKPGSPNSTITFPSDVDLSNASVHNCYQKRWRVNPKPSFPTTTNLARAPSIFPSAHAITDLDNHCFSYYRYHTGPKLASYFASTLWQKYSTNVGLFHPVIFACAAAVGAVHRRFNLGISPEALQWCAYSDHLVKKARRLLIAFERDVRRQDSPVGSTFPNSGPGLEIGTSGYGIDNNDILMAAHMLLFNFDSFQADFPAAVSNLTIGIKHLLRRPMRLIHSVTSYPVIQKDPEVLPEFFEKIKYHAKELFGSEERILTMQGSDLHTALPHIPLKFDSLYQARDYIFTETHHILHTPDRIWKNKASRTTTRVMHTNRLIRWSAAYTETVLCMERTEAEIRAGSVLRVTRSLAYLLLYIALRLTAHEPGRNEDSSSSPIQSYVVGDDTSTEARAPNGEYMLQSDIESEEGEAVWNATGLPGTTSLIMPSIWKAASQRGDMMSYFYRLRIWADMFLDPANPFRHLEHSVSFDSGVGPPLDPIPFPQSSGKTRFIVKYVMDRTDEDVEETDVSSHLGIYGLAEQSSAIEEHAVLEALRSKFPPGTDLKWVDLTLFAEDRRILLQYCCTGPDIWDTVPRWMQEWWIF